jgi:hypothetical protein
MCWYVGLLCCMQHTQLHMQAAQTDTAVKITGVSDWNLFSVLDQWQVFFMPSVNSYTNISVFLTLQIKLVRVNTRTGNVSLYKNVKGKCQHFLLHSTFWIKISLQCFMSLQKSYWHKEKCANNNAYELSVFESTDSSDTAVTIDRQGQGKIL